MARYVPDNNTQRWVIIAPRRIDRPHNTDVDHRECPFCPGNESQTPPEVYRIGPGDKDQPGWEVRVVPNKFAITDIHEVIIHSPSGTDSVQALPPEQVEKICLAYRDRSHFHQDEGQVLIFCNQGMVAGASLAHPHAQLVVVPRQIRLDALSKERLVHVVAENSHFVSYCPDFSQWPYEVWITPKLEGRPFGDTPTEYLKDLAVLLQTMIQRLEKIRDSQQFPFPKTEMFEYNYYISPSANWFLRIIPRFIHRAGFELGTGLSVNSIDPKEAAQELRSI